MKRAVAIRHVPFEDLGSFSDPLRAQGHVIEYAEAGIDRLDTSELRDADLLFILGGPIGANDDQDFPFLKHELRIIEYRLSNDQPIIGWRTPAPKVCLCRESVIPDLAPLRREWEDRSKQRLDRAIPGQPETSAPLTRDSSAEPLPVAPPGCRCPWQTSEFV